MEYAIETILARLCRETTAVYILYVPNERIVFLNEECSSLLGGQALGQTVAQVLSAKPKLRNLFSFAYDSSKDWEYFDIENQRMYKMRQICCEDYLAVLADDITDVLNLNYAVTDYLSLMNSLSDMQAELISNQDRTLEILMKTLIRQFSAQAVYISYCTRQGGHILWSLTDASAEVADREVERLPEAIAALPANRIKAADIVYEFRIVSPEPPELWNANHAIVMNMAGVYLESATLREQIKWDNGHDKFTGLYNRAHYIITASERYLRCAAIGVVFIDIDNLKKTNDEQGHSAGDQLIKTAAEVLRSFISERVDAYRMGGDEFMLVLCDCTEAEVEEVSCQLEQRVNAKNDAAPQTPLLYSSGTAFALQPEDMEAVIRAADSRMYEQKIRHKHFMPKK